MSLFVNQTSFNAGELSPKMLSRTDVSQYSKGCLTLKNFIVTPYGSVERRPGTEYLMTAPSDDMGESLRIIPFVVSSEISFILLFGEKKLSVLNQDGSYHAATPSGTYIQTDYSGSELDRIQYIQSADVMTLVHPNHPPMELKRVTETSFVFAPKEYQYPPMMDANADDSYIVCCFSASYMPYEIIEPGRPMGWETDLHYDGRLITNSNSAGNFCVLACTRPMLTQASIGTMLQVGHSRNGGASLNGEFTANGSSDPIEVNGSWSLVTHGTWTGTLKIMRRVVSDDGASSSSSWVLYQTFSSANDNNVSTSGTETEDGIVQYMLKMENYTQATTGTIKACDYVLTCANATKNGQLEVCLVQPTLYQLRYAMGRVHEPGQTSPISDPDDTTPCAYALCRIKRRLGYLASLDALSADRDLFLSFPNLTSSQLETIRTKSRFLATWEWAEAAWSNRRGYPCAVAFYEERMMFAGTRTQPQTVWGSKTGDWDNFLIGDEDDAGLSFTLCSDTINTICWMCQHDALVIGTLDSEWTISGSSANEALTPSNVRIRRQSVFGSACVPGLMVGDSLIFVQRQGRKIREFVYSWERDGYYSPDLTILAEHVTKSGVVATAIQHLPDTILWCLLANGTLAALTYERDQEIVGWHRHDTDGAFRSLCILPIGGDDRLYFVVRRVVTDILGDEHYVYCLERMASRTYDGVINSRYLDSFRHVSSDEPFATVENVGHLAGRVCSVLGDGSPLPDYQVDASGVLYMYEQCRDVVVGLPYSSELRPMPLEVDTQSGSSIHRRKSVGELRIRVYGSVGGEVRVGSDNWQHIISRDMHDDLLDQPTSEKDETVCLPVMGGYSDVIHVDVRQEQPLPLNVQSIGMTFSVNE